MREMVDKEANAADVSIHLNRARRLLLAILLLGLAGTCAELLLLNHMEDLRQWIPLTLIGASFIVLAWHGARRSATSTRAIRWIMVGFLAGGLAGIYFHYQGSAEFKLESNPSLNGWALVWAAIRAKTPPLLAPGAMIQLGLLGLAYTYRHPALISREREGE
jgi:hypothetical protein